MSKVINIINFNIVVLYIKLVSANRVLTFFLILSSLFYPN